MAKPASKSKPKRRGRPRSADRSAPLTLWVPAGLRRTLERDAVRNGRRSLNGEALARLAYPGRRADAAAHVHALGDLVAQLAASAEAETLGAWHRDRFTFDAVFAGLAELLLRLTPPGDAVRPPALSADNGNREAAARVFGIRTMGEGTTPDDIGRSLARSMTAALRSRTAGAQPPAVPSGSASDDFYATINAALNSGDSK